MHSKSQVGDWLRISTPHPRRVWNDPDCYPTHVNSWCTTIITIEGGTVISRLASTQFSGLATPIPSANSEESLAGGDWTARFILARACCLSLPFGFSHEPPPCSVDEKRGRGKNHTVQSQLHSCRYLPAVACELGLANAGVTCDEAMRMPPRVIKENLVSLR